MVVRDQDQYHHAEEVLLKDDGEYIDLDIKSFSSSPSSPPNSIEFEFNQSTVPITSPADELFYMGKLLPLHLPLRLEMVEKILLNNSSKGASVDQGEGNETVTKKSSTAKKQYWSYKRLKASGSFLKNLFSQFRGGMRGHGSDVNREVDEEYHDAGFQRRSFSGITAMSSSAGSYSYSSSSSSPSSSSSFVTKNRNHRLLDSSEVEKSIQGAIAHCKNSMVHPGRKSVNDMEQYCLASISRRREN